MSPGSLGLLFGAVALGLHMIVVPAAVRLAEKVAPVKVHAFSLAFVQVIFLLAARNAPWAVNVWNGTAIIGFGGVAFLFLFSAVYKSVSIRMLASLAGSESGQVSYPALTASLVRPQFASRVSVLLDMGYVAEREGRYCITHSGRLFAKRWRCVQKLFGIDRSGLYR